MSNQVKKPAPEANFEQAMKRLEEIVEKMESGDLPLEDLIVRYEEGMKDFRDNTYPLLKQAGLRDFV